MMVRVRAAAVVGADAVAPQVARHLTAHRERLAEYREIEARDFAEPDPSETRRLQHLVLQAGISLEEHWVRWLEHANADLQPTAEGDH